MKNPITKLLTAAVLMGAPTAALAAPRTLPSGAPACGNTMGKGGYRDGCTNEERAEWRAAVTAEKHHALTQRRERAARAAMKHEAAKARTVVELARLTVDPLARLRG